jgi:uncharacterized protein (DUF433 family)
MFCGGFEMATNPAFKDLPASILRPLSVSEVAAIEGIERKVVNRMIDDGVLPGSLVRIRKAEKGVAMARYLMPAACPMVRFNTTTGRYLNAPIRGRLMRRIGLLATRGIGPPVETEGAMSIDLEQVIAESVAGMRRLAAAEDEVVIDPDIRGGMPVLRGTRIGVHEIADLAERESVADLLEAYPSLTAERIEAARLYARAHPRVGRPRTATGAPRGARRVSSATIDLGTL